MRILTLQETEIVSGGLGLLALPGVAALGLGAAAAVVGTVLAPVTLGLTLPLGLVAGGFFGLTGVAMLGISAVLPIL